MYFAFTIQNPPPYQSNCLPVGHTQHVGILGLGCSIAAFYANVKANGFSCKVKDFGKF